MAEPLNHDAFDVQRREALHSNLAANADGRQGSASSEDTHVTNTLAEPMAKGQGLGSHQIIHTWNGPDDEENPFNWSPAYKWMITIVVCFISILTGLPAGAYGAGSGQISQNFGVQNQPFDNTIWATVSWNMGAAFWPLIFVPLTESTGRMPGYFGAYIIFVISMFGSAFAHNFATIVVTRFFGGGGSSVAINIVGGSIADIWKGDAARSLPMSIFGFTSVAGIALGPLVGSMIMQINKTDPWRWIFYIQIISNAALIPLFWLLLRETRGDVILAKRAKRLRRTPGLAIYAQSEIDKPSTLVLIKISFWRPVKMLLNEPVVTSFTLWVSFAWGILFLFFSSVVQTFQSAYGFGIAQTGLVQLAISAGALVATLLNPIQDRLYLNSASKNLESPGKPVPEARLYFAVPGSLLFAGGLFWYGWTCRASIHWIVPTIAIGVVGVGIYCIYLAVVNYLTDAYEKFAASALSAASLGRNVFGAFLPLASQPLFNNLGFGVAGSILGAIGLVLSFVPVILLVKGRSIRARSPFMREAAYDDAEEEHKVHRRSSYGHASVEPIQRRQVSMRRHSLPVV